MNQEELLHKIDLFLWKTLPAAEQKAFEAEILQNPSLQEKVAQRQLENEVIKQMQRNDLDAKVKGWLDDIDFDKVTPVDLDEEEKQADTVSPQPHPLFIKTDDSGKSPLRFWLLGIAASIALLLAAGWWWSKSNYESSEVSKRLFVASGNLKIMPIEGRVGDNGVYEPTIDSVQYYFDHKQFDLAIAGYEYFLGDTELLAINQTAKQKVEWQLVLTYLAQNNPKYVARLDDIVNNSNHIFHQNALMLKQKANSFWWKIAN
jgi:hypothetical protein